MWTRGRRLLVLFVVVVVVATAAGRAQEELLWCGKPYDTWPPPVLPVAVAGRGAGRGLVLLPELQPYTDERVGHLWMPWPTGAIAPRLSCTVAGVPLRVEGSNLQRVTDAAGEPVARLAFALAQLPLGRMSELACVLSTDTLGATAVHGRVRVARHPPHPHAVKIHTRLRALWTDDRPFLPVGFYLEYNRWQSGPANFSRVLAHEAVNGFNVPLPYRSGSPDAVRDSDYRALLDAAATMGLRVHFNMYGVGMEAPSASKTDKINAYLDLVMDHPALLAYYIADEPDGEGRGLDPAWLADTVATIRARDPYHPITLVLNCVEHPYRTVDDYAVHADIVLSDPYPIGLRNQVGCDLCAGTVVDVRDRVKFMMAELPLGQPLWMVPQAFGGEQHWDRQPTAREVRVMTYTSIIGGARGVQYFLLGALLPEYNQGVHFEPHDTLWSECRRLALELADLAPALLTMDARVPVRVGSPTTLVEAAAFYEAGRGTVTVLVVNLDVQPQVLQLTVDLPRAPATGTATVLFEQRAVPVTAAGDITDLLDGFGTRAYRLRVAPAVATLATEDNLVLNPSFEVQSSVGRVDSYLATYGLGGSVVADPWFATDGYYAVRVTNAGTAGIVNATVTVAGVASFLGSRLVAGGNYTAGVDVRVASPGARVRLTTCFGTRTVAVESAASWTRLELSGRTANDTLCQVEVLLLDAGTAWLDAVSLRPSAAR